jgi:hypothetical protein
MEKMTLNDFQNCCGFGSKGVTESFQPREWRELKMAQLKAQFKGFRTVSFGLLAISTLTVQSVFAEPSRSQCFGVLHQSKDDLMIGGGRGEGEGICIINKAEISKVLRTCHIGGRCIVEGSVDNCQDSGECVEITKITDVRKR